MRVLSISLVSIAFNRRLQLWWAFVNKRTGEPTTKIGETAVDTVVDDKFSGDGDVHGLNGMLYLYLLIISFVSTSSVMCFCRRQDANHM